MIIIDLFRINEWPIRKFIVTIILFLAAYDGIFILNKYVFYFNSLLQLIGFLILTFLPGLLILRLLKIRSISKAQNILLAIGLSLSFVMVMGLILNTTLPLVGISKPFSVEPLVYAINFGILILSITSYLCTKGVYPVPQDMALEFNLKQCSLILLPIFSVLGARLMYLYNLNTTIVFLFFVISLTPLIVTYERINKSLYPFFLFIIALSILLQANLASGYLWSFDIFFEINSASLVLANGVWNPDLSSNSANSLLLINILAPTYALICNLNLIQVFKIIFPFIFALTPPVLFEIYQKFKLTNSNKDFAFLAVVVFIFYFGFFKDMPDKQHISEFFLALLLMCLLIEVPNRAIVSIILLFSLVVSHYGISYIFLISLILVKLLSFIKRGSQNLVTSNFVMLFFILTIAWYMFVASGVQFEAIVGIGSHIYYSISHLISSDERSGVAYLSTDYATTISWKIYKFFHIMLQGFIALGILKLLTTFNSYKNKDIELSYLIFIFYIFLLLQITITYGMGLDRIIQITLVLLSPLAISGFIFMFDIISTIVRRRVNYKNVMKTLSIFLSIFFLLNSGFIFQTTGDTLPPYCISLNKSAGWPNPNEQDMFGASWLKDGLMFRNEPFNIVSDDNTKYFLAQFLYGNLSEIHLEWTTVSPSTYLFLSSQKISDPLKKKVQSKVSKSSKIFGDQGCSIFFGG